MNRQKKLYLLLAAVVAAAVGIGLFVKNYRVFQNPFQIISYENIEKNKQGICVDENRKLSREELLSRAMASYFDYYRKWSFRNEAGDGRWREYCQDEGETDKYCWIKEMPKWKIIDYLQKSKCLDRKSLRKISFVDAMSGMKTFQYPNSYGFMFYSDNDGYSFYPHDCCSIELLSELKPYHFPLNNTPEYFQERGIGNYFLRL